MNTTTMKNLVLLIFYSILLNTYLSGQNCLTSLGEYTGYQISEYHDNINNAACNLLDSIPVEQRDSFAIFDFGYYSILSATINGNNDAWNSLISEVENQSFYYLLFAKETDHTGYYSELKISLKLPNSGKFSCLDQMSSTLRYDIQNKLKFIANDIFDQEGRDLRAYELAATAVIDSLSIFIGQTVICCDPSRNETECTICIFTPNELLDNLKDKQFVLDLSFVIDDPQYVSFQSANYVGNNRNFQDPLNIDVEFGDGSVLDLDYIITQHVNDQISYLEDNFNTVATTNVYKFKYPRDCGSFTQIWEQYENDLSDIKYFIAYVNIDNKFGVLGYHSNYQLPQSEASSSREFNNDDILQDEIENLNNVYEEGQRSCKDFAVSIVNYIGASYYIAKDNFPYKTQKQRDIAYKLYSDAIVHLDESEYRFESYWNREYLILLKNRTNESGCGFFCKIRIKWATTDNLCSETFHTILEMCTYYGGGMSIVCGTTNAIYYLTEGKLGQAALEGLGSGGDMIKLGIRFGGRFIKPLSSCIDNCRALNFEHLPTGVIRWGSKDKLRRLIKELNLSIPFNGIELIYDSGIHQAHHIIPWQLCDPKKFQHPLLKKLFSKGWHPNDPYINGLILPKKLPDGTKFHLGSHPPYNKWVNDALTIIQKNVSEAEHMDKVNLLNQLLVKRLEDAYNSGNNITAHFNDIKKFDLVMLE